jgi:AbrB family looped-hinge helix DNA binding protein
MGAVAKVTSKGQITLPAAMREEFGIQPGDQIHFFRDLHTNQPTFVVRHGSHEPLRPIMKWRGPTITDKEIDEGIGDAVVEDFLRADRRSRPARDKS